LKPGVVVTLPSFQLEGLRSPSTFSGAITPSLNLAHSSSTACARIEAGILEAGDLCDLIDPGEMLMSKRMSLRGAV
jgi:hypothetical protein